MEEGNGQGVRAASGPSRAWPVLLDRAFGRADITILLKHSRSTSLTTYLKASDANLKPLETEFADFNDGD